MESLNVIATVLFAVAILHTFVAKKFIHWSKKFPTGSAAENFLHLLGEVEVVFGLWAAVFFAIFAMRLGLHPAIQYLEDRDFTEPAFVFVIMTVCATRPILGIANRLINGFSRLVPLPRAHAFYFSCLVLGPILGSLITEPAAMTVTALILLERFYKKGLSKGFKYATLGLLFVNISIGGVFTPYAAPPILMVAPKWGWDLTHMIEHFALKAAIALVLSTLLVIGRYSKELGRLDWDETKSGAHKKIPLWVEALYFIFLTCIVLSSHHWVLFGAIFLFFLGLVTVTREHQSSIKLKEALLVAFFLAGLVVLGASQKWWLELVLAKLDALTLYLGAVGLTAVTDNATLTFLGSQVETITEASKFALVAGAVVGGGLTVIANAPNPAGYGILNASFGKEGIQPGKLFLGALIPTIIAALCFWLPTFWGSF